ncbi:MAG: hypothetical protein BRD55_05445 [Bacteroidetes bacterium SW_9_63_38]|nr:MAG: hypothetical protein BRD55_05445 [Bacteroidetes bacterium SW_9_63_38]
MRYLTSLVLAFALLAGSASVAQITTETSGLTDVKRIESESMRSLNVKSYSGSSASYRAAYINDPNDGISWVISFYGYTKEKTQVSSSNQFRVVADGEPYEPVRLESKSRSIDGTLLEIKRATFPRAAFEKIAHAGTVTFSIGGAQFEAIPPQRRDMRQVLEKVPSNATPQTASNR